MNLPPHRMVPPVESRKRKEREILHYNNSRTTTEVTTKPKPSAPLSTVSANERSERPINNRLLAGCMAYEFLTKGTLLGNMYNPARTEVAAAAGAKLLEPRGVKDLEQYGEIARILKTEGTYIPSIVNPAQLARWIQM